jgi:hypothetical protein
MGWSCDKDVWWQDRKEKYLWGNQMEEEKQLDQI